MDLRRREFLKRLGIIALGSTAAAGAYPFLEAKWCRIARRIVTLPNLPPAFRGTTLALVSDVHHGPFVPLAYIQHVVEMVNTLDPDLVLLTGDYVSKHPRFIAPGIEALGKLKGNLGRFAVLGNHDNWESKPQSCHALAAAGITQVDNKGVWLERGKARLRICGVGDLWTDHQDLNSALGDASKRDAVILLSHNPDFAETLRDHRVGLILSGHTHGGQVIIPGYGAPIVPSKYGQKYVHGLVQGPVCQVYVTRGVGTVTPPVRLFCRPEVVLITLT
jgi:uncharacterized protein